MSFLEQYLLQLNTEKRRWRRAVTVLTCLSFIVALVTVWNLRMTGITIANGATCGYEEHQHTAECLAEPVLICEYAVQEEPTEERVTEAVEETTEIAEVTAEVTTEVVAEPTELAEVTTEAAEVTTEVVEETTEVAEGATEVAEETTEVTQEVVEVAGETTEVPVESTEATVEPLPAPVHTHTDSCYAVAYSCNLEEHIHKIACFSDATADVETAEIWEATLPELTGNVEEDILLIAQSQLGYGESDKNYILAADGETKIGITRYGQWYGNPYGDWANMFTSFCLRYAGLPDDFLNSGAEVMQRGWEEQERYYSVGNYLPVAGDIVFLDKNLNGTVETTAVVVSCLNGLLTVVEGDVENTVVENAYPAMDSVVVGYGVSNPEKQLLMFGALPTATSVKLGNTVTYSSTLLTEGGDFIIYTSDTDGTYYAIDGNGEAIELQIDSSGAMYADVADQTTLYWNFEKTTNYDSKPTYYVTNVATGKYLYPTSSGPVSSTRQGAALYTSGSGVRMRGVRQNAYVQLSDLEYTISSSQNNGSVMYFGKGPTAINLWLDGTCGNLMPYRGSDNTRMAVSEGVEYQLPSQWKSPTKYSYKLAGWVNVETGEYYLPGAKITVTEDTVMYADWVATTYDIGVYNSYVADTLSTKDFITTKMFDYSSLINLLSSKVSVTVSGTSHSESWSHVASGNVSYKGQPTLNFSFSDHDGSGSLSNLNSLNNPNKYTGGTAVYPGIYNEALGEALFSTDNLFNPETGEGIVGKHYLGEGDHLFQIDMDPNSEFYGYYYYDAKRNAASYNQKDQRFYVYDYLARSSDSANNNDSGKYSDFLPLNSPYANTNGQTVKTYNYDGDNGEYAGVSHYTYDARYDASGSATNQIQANLWFGMRTDVQFGLHDTPGERLSDGTYGNKDIYGNDMHFKFAGDDDVWILVDGKVVLDLGGIHQAAEGDINFSTGEIRVNGQSNGSLSEIYHGEHTLSILYLERGSSMSNCAIYFNLAPRFSLTLQKEDVLTQEVLNGAQFAVYNDLACTDPCELWESQISYKNGEQPTNVFTIQRGSVYIWGFSPARTYYIKEVAPPNAGGYSPASGVIQLALDKNGLNSYSATILEGVDANGNKEPISHGFTLHGFRIDEENQAAYIVITNAQDWVTETTSVYVEKRWNDNENHDADAVTVYLNVTDDDGTVRRLREIALSEENDWKYTWTNLPKYTIDPETMTESDIPVRYSVSEAYIPGYMNQVEVLESGTYTEISWPESTQIVNGESYILKTSQGYLSAVSEDENTLEFVDEATAKESPLALWTATYTSGLVKLTNQVGQSLNYYASGSTRYFNLTTGSSSSQNLTPTAQNGAFRFAYKSGRTSYYMSTTLNSRGYIDAKSQSNSALSVNLIKKTLVTNTVKIDGYGYAITNTPLALETSLKVTKKWDYPGGDPSYYEKEQVTVRLLANGVDTGRTVTVSLKSNWTGLFNGLPYEDEEGKPIVYTVEESWDNDDWLPLYGAVITINGDVPTYETTITNTYRWIGSYELPGTGGIGTTIYILCGLILVIGPLVYGFSLRRRFERRSKH